MDASYIEAFFRLAGVIFAFGVFYSELKAIRKDIARLEKKQEKYNNLQERVLRSELKLENYDREIAEIKEGR